MVDYDKTCVFKCALKHPVEFFKKDCFDLFGLIFKLIAIDWWVCKIINYSLTALITFNYIKKALKFLCMHVLSGSNISTK